MAAHGVKRSRKIVVLGFSMVGKTATCRRLCTGQYDENYEPTVEQRFATTMRHRGVDVDLSITDSQGRDEQELFVTQYGLREGFILMYSVTSRRTFQTIMKLNDTLVAMTGNPNIPRVLVGNKVDMESYRMVSYEEGEAAAKQMGCAFVECSAALDLRVRDAFQLMLDEIDKIQNEEDYLDSSALPFRTCCCWRLRQGGQALQCDELATYRSAAFAVVLTLLLGIAAIAGGFLVRSGTQGVDGALLAYMMVGFGFVLTGVSICGFIGVKKDSNEFLTAYGLAVAVILLVELVIAIFLFEESSSLKNNMQVGVPVIVIAGLAQLLAIGLVWLHQRNKRRLELEEEMEQPYLSLYR